MFYDEIVASVELAEEGWAAQAVAAIGAAESRLGGAAMCARCCEAAMHGFFCSTDTCDACDEERSAAISCAAVVEDHIRCGEFDLARLDIQKYRSPKFSSVEACVAYMEGGSK